MKFWKAMLPNLAIALNVALMVVIYLDMRNPMMGFLSGATFVVLAAASCLSSIATAVVLYKDWRKPKRPKAKSEKAPVESPAEELPLEC